MQVNGELPTQLSFGLHGVILRRDSTCGHLLRIHFIG